MKVRAFPPAATPGRAVGEGKTVAQQPKFFQTFSPLGADQDRYLLAAIVEHSNDAIISKTLDGIIVNWNAAAERIYGYQAGEAIGQSIYILVPPEQQAEVGEILAKIRRGEYVDHYETVRIHKEGQLVHVSLSMSPIKDSGGKVVGVSAIARDISAQKQAEAALRRAHEELEQRVRMRTREIVRRQQVAESLRDILAILNSDRDLDEILDYIVERARALLRVDRCAIYHVGPARQKLTIKAACGKFGQALRNTIVPMGQDPLGQAVSTQQPVAISNWVGPPPEFIRLSVQAVEDGLVPTPPRPVSRIGAMLAVPLVIKRDVYGAIVHYYAEPKTFSDDDISLAVTLADQVALAIENARLREHLQEDAVAAERSRLSRELHDAVTQTLFSASLIGEVLPRLWEKDQAEGRRRLEELRLLTRGALAEMRTLLVELRPAALTEARIGELLRHLTVAMTSRIRTSVQLTVEGDCHLPPDVQVALYRITQEALNNVAKHAKPSRVAVDLTCGPAVVTLTINDDGRGFDLARTDHRRLGLAIMRERAEAIGARYFVRSRPGMGTRIEVIWPIPDTEE